MPIFRALEVPLKKLLTEKVEKGFYLSIWYIALATAVFLLFKGSFGTGQWALIYLLLINFIAYSNGVKPAILAAILSFLCWNFFFMEPYYTFYVADPQNWLALGAFLIAGILVGKQTGEMREREYAALKKEQETNSLARLSARMVSYTSPNLMATSIFNEIIRMTNANQVILFIPDVKANLKILMSSSKETIQEREVIQRIAEWSFENNKAVGLPEINIRIRDYASDWPASVDHNKTTVLTESDRKDVFIPFQTGTRIEGVLYVGEKEDKTPFEPDEIMLFVSFANLAGAFLERARMQKDINDANTFAEAGRMKSTLLMSVSDHIQRPLDEISEKIDSYLKADPLSPDIDPGELVNINNSLKEIGSSIGEILQIPKTDRNGKGETLEWHKISEIVGSVMFKLDPKQRERLKITIDDSFPKVFVDYFQLARVFELLISNSLLNSPESSKVSIAAEEEEKDVKIRIINQDYGTISENDSIILMKTNLQFTISSEIIRFHNGRIWMEELKTGGVAFVISLPKN